MKILFQIAIIFTIINQITCNIWDNIFGNQDAPNVYFPSNFEVKFSLTNGTNYSDQASYAIEVQYSSDLGLIKLIGYMETVFGTELEMGQFIFNQTNNTAYTYNIIKKKCQHILMPQISRDQNQLSLNDMSSLSVNDIWRFVAFYNGLKTVNGKRYHKYDINTLFEILKLQDVEGYVYFTEENVDLSFIQLEIQQKTVILYVKEPLEEVEFEELDFKIPKKWKCDKKQQELDYSKQYLSDIVKQLQYQYEDYSKKNKDLDLLGIISKGSKSILKNTDINSLDDLENNIDNISDIKLDLDDDLQKDLNDIEKDIENKVHDLEGNTP